MTTGSAGYKSQDEESREPPTVSPDGRALRAQGRQTMARLLDAGLEAFAERGYHAARVDDVVRAADTSHGTFYLYFASKEDLLRALAVECATEWGRLADRIDELGADVRSTDALREIVRGFIATYRRYGPVIRAWMEDQVDDKQVNRLGLDAFTRIATALGRQMRRSDGRTDAASIAALMAMLERFAYFVVSRAPDEDDAVVDTLAITIQRGFFA